MANYANFQEVIKAAFKAYGYTPTQAEIDQLTPIVDAKRGGSERGYAAVANYVQTVRSQQNRRANDPLNQVIADERGFFNETEARAAELKSSLDNGVKLYGSLTPEQFDSYLVPLTRYSAESKARLEGDASRRGIAGSSTELQTLADSERKYREDILSQALQIGLSERDRTSRLLEIQYGLLPGSLSRQATIAGQQSQMAFDETSYNNELPIYLRGISAQENAIQEAIAAREAAAKQARKNGLFSTVGSVGGAALGMMTPLGPTGALIGSQIGSQFGSALAGGPSGSGVGGLDLSSLLLMQNNMPRRRQNFIGGNTYSLPNNTEDIYSTANS